MFCASFLVPDNYDVPQGFLRFLVFFLIGANASSFVRDLVLSIPPAVVPIFAILYVIGAALAQRYELMYEPIIFFVLATGASFTVMSFSNAISSNWLGQTFKFVGKYSLYIYLMNFLPTAGVRIVFAKLGLNAFTLTSALIGTAIAVIVSIVAYEIAMKTPFKFIFRIPRWLDIR
jgi:peptidoglycan/LPS O-acetylase OafA/YrhL